MKKIDTEQLFLILWFIVVIVFLLSSCSASYHLQRAKAKGAEVRSDTTWQDITIITPELKFGTTIRPDWQVHKIEKPFVSEHESGARTEVTISLQDYCPPDCVDTVMIETYIPAREETKKVPTRVHTEISAGYTKWDLVILAIACLAVGAVAAKLFWR